MTKSKLIEINPKSKKVLIRLRQGKYELIKKKRKYYPEFPSIKKTFKL